MHVDRNNKPAQMLYRKIGFEVKTSHMIFTIFCFLSYGLLLFYASFSAFSDGRSSKLSIVTAANVLASFTGINKYIDFLYLVF